MTNRESKDPRAEMPRFRGPRGHGPGGGAIESAKDARKATLRLLGYLRPYSRQVAGVTVLVIVGTLASLAGPMLIGTMIDRFIVPGDVPGLTRAAILLLVVYVAAAFANGATGILMVNLAQGLVKDIRSQLFGHIQTLSMKFYDDHETGDLMSRITNDTDAINRVLANGLTQLASNLLMLVGVFVAMFILSWQLALGALLVLPLMAAITGTIAGRARQAFRDVQRNLGRLNAFTEENVAAVRVVQVFARESETIAQFQAVNGANRDAGIKAQSIVATLMPLITTMRALAVAVIAGLGGWLALRDLVTVGVIVSFVVYVQQFFEPLRSLAQLYNQLQSALAGAERIFEVMDARPAVADLPDALPLPKINGHVRFDDVCFEYEEDKPVLCEVSLEALPGQTVALVGPTGAGKTTIIRLLSRLYDVTEGAITIDGHDIRTIQQDSLRQQLGIVLQDTFLFSGTVMENIRYGRLDATDEEVIAAARLANADQFISRLPNGYETEVSEQGSNFSQGQRQLIAIARAVLADPRILILDEATSSVDTRTEMHIQEALLRLMEGRTAFVIAHRLSTIREADDVIVINDHGVVERGTHEELLAQRGFYHDLYMSQFRRAEALAT